MKYHETKESYNDNDYYIDNSVDYRGIKVDKLALKYDKEMVDIFINRLSNEQFYEISETTNVE